MAFLIHFRRMYGMGRFFGANGQQLPENNLFGAYGCFVDVDEQTLPGESPCIV